MVLAPATGHRLVVLRSGSMEPAMPAGSLLVIESVDPREVRPGDVVTVALDSGSLLTHRVVRGTSLDGYPAVELHGDANAAADTDVVSLDRLVGRVTLVVPIAGYAAWWLANPGGLAAFARADRAHRRRDPGPRPAGVATAPQASAPLAGAPPGPARRAGRGRRAGAVAGSRQARPRAPAGPRARRRGRRHARVRCVLHRVRGRGRQHVHHGDVGPQRLPKRVVGAMGRGRQLGALQRDRMGCRDQAAVERGRCRDRQRLATRST